MVAEAVERTPMSWHAGPDEFVPDVMVYSETDEARRFTGTPVLCVEVLSSNRIYDPTVRARKYAAAGVDHYWTADLEREVLNVCVRAGTVSQHAQTVTGAEPAEVGFGVGRVRLDLAALLH